MTTVDQDKILGLLTTINKRLEHIENEISRLRGDLESRSEAASKMYDDTQAMLRRALK